MFVTPSSTAHTVTHRARLPPGNVRCLHTHAGVAPAVSSHSLPEATATGLSGTGTRAAQGCPFSGVEGTQL